MRGLFHVVALAAPLVVLGFQAPFVRRGVALGGLKRRPTSTPTVSMVAPRLDEENPVYETGPKKVVVLGGDGFCGWPTTLHLSDAGHEVIIVDNLSRRYIDIELGQSSLTPIESPEVRVKAWEEVSGKKIRFVNFDTAKEYHVMLKFLEDEKPVSDWMCLFCSVHVRVPV